MAYARPLKCLLRAPLTWLEYQGQSKVSDASGQIALQQDIFALEVAMGDDRLQSFRLRAGYLIVQVHQATGHRLGDAAQLRPGHGMRFQIIAQRSIAVVGSDQPIFRLLQVLFDADKLQNVRVLHARQLHGVRQATQNEMCTYILFDQFHGLMNGRK